MNIQSYFSDIREHIINELRLAESSIYIAVAWFTDKELFDILCNKAALGLKVKLIAIKDEINTSGSIDFTDLLKNGGKVWLVEDQKTMHNKFCVIDKHIVLNGSYNWTYKASDNHENIMVIANDNETTENYLDQFKKIKTQYFGTEKDAYHKLSLRLAALKNLIQLNDRDDILKQGEKIKNLSLFVYLDQYKKIQSILDFCKENKLDKSIHIIDKLIIETENFIPEEEIAANTYDNIFEAAAEGSIIGVELFLRQGIDINIKSNNGDSLLHLACCINHKGLIKYLIDKSININCLNVDNLYPIDLINRGEYFNDTLFTLLYENGAILNPKNDTLCRQISLTFLFIDTTNIISYINSFSNIDFSVQECYFVNLLRDALLRHNYDLAQYLIRHGVDINSKLSNGKSIFNSFDFDSGYKLKSNIECVRYLIEQGADWKKYFGSEIFLYIFYRDLSKVENYLVLNEFNSFGHTPLYYLCLMSFDLKSLEEEFTKPAIESISKIHNFNFQINTPDKNGITLLENPECKVWLPYITKSLFKRILLLKTKKFNSKNLTDLYDNCLIAMNTLFDKLEINIIVNSCIIKEFVSGIPDYPLGTTYTFKENLLSLAICINDSVLVKKLIENGVDINCDVDISFLNLYEDSNSQKQISLNSVSSHLPRLYPVKNDKNTNIISYISCLEYSRRLKLKEIEKLLVDHGAVISECDKRNNYVEQQVIIANLAIDKERKEKELEIERKKIEQQKIEDIKKKEALEYENSNFLKKLVVNYNRKKKSN